MSATLAFFLESPSSNGTIRQHFLLLTVSTNDDSSHSTIYLTKFVFIELKSSLI